METMLTRLRKVFLDSGESQTAIAKKTNVTSAYIWKILNNDSVRPRDLFIDSVCREFNINEEWLRNGEGEMYDVAPTDDFMEIATKIDVKDKKARQAIVDYWNLSDTDKELFWKFIERFIAK